MKNSHTSTGSSRFGTALLITAGAVAATLALAAAARAITIPGRTTGASPFMVGQTGTSPAPVVIVNGGGSGPTDAPPGN